MRRVYFDHASTTNVDPEVLKTYEHLLEKYYVNSESLYDEGVEIHHMVEKSRAAAAALLGVKPQEILFTSGSSEANSTVIKGVPLAVGKKHIITTNVEHSSILNACRMMHDTLGCEITYLPVNSDGVITEDQVKAALREDTALVSVMCVNNETGAINPIQEIASYVKKNSHAYFHSDLTQAVGKTEIDFTDLDLASISAHKLNGLKGSGILMKKAHVPLIPLINGGEQEYGLRGGTANAPADLVFAKTLRLALENGRKYHDQTAGLKARLLAGLKKIDGIEINSPENSVVSTVNFSYEPIPSEVMQNALNGYGYMVSARSTCDSRSYNPSYVLLAMGYSERRAGSCIRVSLGRENTAAEVDGFLAALKEIIAKYGSQI